MASSDPALIISLPLWWRLVRELRRRGRGVTESGAFILGRRDDGAAWASSLVFYDEVDPGALKSGIVRLSGKAMNAVWETCSRKSVEVLADVHTHPKGAVQSRSDQEYPMVATRGHIALIVPNFARSPFDLAGVGHYRYEGAKRWSVHERPRLAVLNIHFQGAR